MTAAIYARRAAKSTLVLEASSYGGQIIKTPDIENYPAEQNISGTEFATRLYEQATSHGAEFVFEAATAIADEGGLKRVTTKKDEYTARAVIIATGSANRTLGVDGEEALVGRGISYCATCDGNFFRGRDVAVVGGGNTALEDALYMADIAKTVYLIHRRDSFRGDETTVRLLTERENVKIIYNSRVTKLEAERRLTGIEVTDTSGEVTRLDISGLFVAVGRIPVNGAFGNMIELDSAGWAVSGEDCRTRTQGVFVAGDCRAKDVRQLVTAAADGAVAANAAIKYISEK
ncbi:MAG: FAD-dependent oxidoreductase [Clostridia bacterium]|nr:FAD-dependent oxidoreductase [Clostridia bacterium]